MKLYQTKNAGKVYVIIAEKDHILLEKNKPTLLMADYIDEMPENETELLDYGIRRFIVKRGNMFHQFILRDPYSRKCAKICMQLAINEFYR